LQEELRGRRGVLCKVVQGGRIRRGDSIQIQAPASAVAREREVSKSG
jgi:MOSC domain-containing protein YiiM